jgi:hypothetical protein
VKREGRQRRGGRRSGGGGGLRFGGVSSVKTAAASGRTDLPAVKMALGRSKSEGAQAAGGGAAHCRPS